MKKTRYLSVLTILFVGWMTLDITYATEKQYEEHSLRIMLNKKAFDKNIVALFETDSVLNSWVRGVRQSFPFSQDETLKRVYYIDFTCPREQIMTRMSTMSWIDDIMPIEKSSEEMLYTPTDWFWKVTKTTDPTFLWHLTKIEAEKAWDITKGNPDIKIAVIDKPIDVTHPDLVNKMVYTYDPYTRVNLKPTDGSIHGTTVASFVAASTDDPVSSPAQSAAIGFNCKIVGYDCSSNFLEKAHHAAFVENVSAIVSCAGRGIRSFPTDSEIERKVVKEILDKGTIIVAPAGNGWKGTHNDENGALTPFYPFHPSYDNRIIIVSSTDINDNHTFYNDDGTNGTHSHFSDVTVCAPGYKMMGAKPTGTDSDGKPIWPYFQGCSGTSFSAPIVAGLCGLMKSVFPSLTPAKAKQILKTTTDPIKDVHLYPGQLGSGRINAYKAVLAVKQYADTCQASYKDIVVSGQNVNRNVCTLRMENTTIKGSSSLVFRIDTDAVISSGFSIEKGSSLEILPQ